MKQAVLRKTLTGAWTAFEFPKKGRRYFVKNYTDGDILVSFDDEATDAESIKIKKGIGEEVSICFEGIDRKETLTDFIFVKGTGEVEVQALDIYIPKNDQTISDGVLSLADQDTVSGDTIEIPTAEFDGQTMII